MRRLSFNNIPLPAGVEVVDIQIGNPTPQIMTVSPPGVRGEIRTRRTMMRRVVTIQVMLWDAINSEEIAATADALRGWCYSDGVGELRLPNRDAVYINAECSAYPAPFEGYMNQQPATIEFTACDPDFYSETEFTANTPATVTIGGTVDTFIELTATVGAAGQFSIAIDGNIIRPTNNIDAGTVYYNSNTGELTLTTDGDTSDISIYCPIEQDLIYRLKPGLHTVACSHSAAVKWRNHSI